MKYFAKYCVIVFSAVAAIAALIAAALYAESYLLGVVVCVMVFSALIYAFNRVAVRFRLETVDAKQALMDFLTLF